MRLLHIADVHLDRPFTGMDVESARDRRSELRTAFDRCLAEGKERGVDVITIGGDLWEDEYVTPDTLRWVADRLERTGVPLVLITGNHDPLSAGGPYDRADFGSSVTVLPEGPELSEHRIGDLSIWGMSWKRGAPLTAETLDSFRAPDDGRRHVLLLHGTCGPYFEGAPYCPFTEQQVANAGFDLCLAGHLHGASAAESLVIYPGSPEPLAWSQDGRHTVAVVDFDSDIDIDQAPRAELVDVNRRRYVECAVDCSDAASSAEVELRVLREVDDLGAAEGLGVRLVLSGRVLQGCDVDGAALRRTVLARGLAACEVRDRTKVAFDLDEIAEGPGVTAAFYASLSERITATPSGSAEAATLELALELGLRALHGDTL